MRIDFPSESQAPVKQEAQSGDLIEVKDVFGTTSCIVLDDNELAGFYDHLSPNLSAKGTERHNNFLLGKYKILARAGDWHITVDKRAA